MTRAPNAITFTLRLSDAARRNAAKLKSVSSSIEAGSLLVLEKNAKANLRRIRHPKTKMPVRHSVTRTSREVIVKAYIEDEYSSMVRQALSR